MNRPAPECWSWDRECSRIRSRLSFACTRQLGISRHRTSTSTGTASLVDEADRVWFSPPPPGLPVLCDEAARLSLGLALFDSVLMNQGIDCATLILDCNADKITVGDLAARCPAAREACLYLDVTYNLWSSGRRELQ